MCDPVSISIGAGAILTAGASVYSAEKNASAQEESMNQAKKNAQEQLAAANEAAGAEAKKSRRASAADVLYGEGSAQSNSALTGPDGISTDALSLGKTSLLGS